MLRRIRWRIRRRPRRKLPAAVLPLTVALLLTVCFFRMVSAQFRPVVETMAASRATNLITQAISTVVDDCLTENEMSYSDFVSMETDALGQVTSLAGNTAGNNRFKRLVTERLTEQLGELASEDLGIPLGSLTGQLLLSGLGPTIRVNVCSVGDVTATYFNSFTAAGVNQTIHRVDLDITAVVYLLLPGEIIPVTVSDSVCVAETVIVGQVPDTYLNLNRGES